MKGLNWKLHKAVPFLPHDIMGKKKQQKTQQRTSLNGKATMTHNTFDLNLEMLG